MDVAQKGLMLAAQTAAPSEPKLQFTGDLGLVSGVAVAVVLGALAWLLYRRDLAGRGGLLRILLPLLRVLVVVCLVGVLTGPTLVRTRHQGTVAHLLVFMDGSASMTALDEQMETVRKLRIASNLGWVNGAGADDPMRRLRDQLAQAAAKTESLRFLVNPVDLTAGLKELQELISDAAGRLDKLPDGQWPAPRRVEVRTEVLDPLAALDVTDPARARDQAVVLQPSMMRWKGELDLAVAKADAQTTNKLDAPALAAIKRFDKTPRWERVQAALLAGGESLFERLTVDHRVSLYALTNDTHRVLWQAPQRGNAGAPEFPKTFGFGPQMTNVMETDLVTGLEQAMAGVDAAAVGAPADGFARKQVVVLITDGQHNTKPNPNDLARRLGSRQVPMHVIGVGTTRQPLDLAVQRIFAPAKVPPNARLGGSVVLQDGMPAGRPFTLAIEHKGRRVWSLDLMTTEGGHREIPFDFAIEEIVESEKQIQNADLLFSNLPLTFDVKVQPLEGEANPDNNSGKLRTSVVTQKNHMLLIDGRPRWEQRYLKNLFERDDRWEIHTLLPDPSGQGGLGQRGPKPNQFPSTRERLFTYQVILLGDISPQLFRPEELQWMREFVQFNSGGVIFIDGHYEKLSSFLNTALQPLFPVSWAGLADYKSLNLTYRPLTDEAALKLDADAKQNATLWAGLPGPRRMVVAEKLPGADVLLELTEDQGNVRLPAMVFRRFGSGRVLYSATDETWRWRQDVGDRHFEKFWKQAAKIVMEEPFAVMDRFLAIDSGPPHYEVGERAQIRVRMRDPGAMAWLETNKAKPVAMLMQAGKVVAQIPLDADFQSALYRGFSEPLLGGDYEVRIRVPGLAEDQVKARTQFSVASVPSGEMSVLHCHEKQLRQMAADSGGRYYPEEELQQLVDALKPLSSGETFVEEEKLWQSYWTFLPIMLLLTVEWALRKRAGLI